MDVPSEESNSSDEESHSSESLILFANTSPRPRLVNIWAFEPPSLEGGTVNPLDIHYEEDLDAMARGILSVHHAFDPIGPGPPSSAHQSKAWDRPPLPPTPWIGPARHNAMTASMRAAFPTPSHHSSSLLSSADTRISSLDIGPPAIPLGGRGCAIVDERGSVTRQIPSNLFASGIPSDGPALNTRARQPYASHQKTTYIIGRDTGPQGGSSNLSLPVENNDDLLLEDHDSDYVSSSDSSETKDSDECFYPNKRSRTSLRSKPKEQVDESEADSPEAEESVETGRRNTRSRASMRGRLEQQVDEAQARSSEAGVSVEIVHHNTRSQTSMRAQLEEQVDESQLSQMAENIESFSHRLRNQERQGNIPSRPPPRTFPSDPFHNLLHRRRRNNPNLPLRPVNYLGHSVPDSRNATDLHGHGYGYGYDVQPQNDESFFIHDSPTQPPPATLGDDDSEASHADPPLATHPLLSPSLLQAVNDNVDAAIREREAQNAADRMAEAIKEEEEDQLSDSTE